jgi:hypothetical protein
LGRALILYAMLISFPDSHFLRKKQRPLSQLMIASLLILCSKQKNCIRFDSRDIKSSFTTLINRGFIVSKEITQDGEKELIWEVTEEAIQMLQKTGSVI